MWEHFSVARPYRHAPQVCSYLLIFIIHIFCWLCLANNMEYNFQPWPFGDVESQPLLDYRWSRITNVTGTITGRYMMYSNTFDCITSTQVRQHLSTCPLYLHVIYLVVLTSVKNLQVIWCNTPDVTVADTLHLEYLYNGCYSTNLIQWRWYFLRMELDHFKSIQKFEFLNSCSDLIVDDLDHTSKMESDPHNLFYKYANLQKLWRPGSNCFKCPNRAARISF
jgi:hypothetical protein